MLRLALLLAPLLLSGCLTTSLERLSLPPPPSDEHAVITTAVATLQGDRVVVSCKARRSGDRITTHGVVMDLQLSWSGGWTPRPPVDPPRVPVVGQYPRALEVDAIVVQCTGSQLRVWRGTPEGPRVIQQDGVPPFTLPPPRRSVLVGLLFPVALLVDVATFPISVPVLFVLLVSDARDRVHRR